MFPKHFPKNKKGNLLISVNCIQSMLEMFIYWLTKPLIGLSGEAGGWRGGGGLNQLRQAQILHSVDL